MVQEAQAQGVIVILGTLPTSKDFDLEIQTWNAQIRQISQTYGTQLADYNTGMANPASVPDVAAFHQDLENAPLMAPDGIYPNAAGYVVMWGIVCVPLDGDHVE
jgi:lysophospholipase L1-like esterase